MMRTHRFTEPTDEAPPVDIGRFVREWEEGADERDQMRSLANWHFDQARDRALNAMWKDQ